MIYIDLESKYNKSISLFYVTNNYLGGGTLLNKYYNDTQFLDKLKIV